MKSYIFLRKYKYIIIYNFHLESGIYEIDGTMKDIVN